MTSETVHARTQAFCMVHAAGKAKRCRVTCEFLGESWAGMVFEGINHSNMFALQEAGTASGQLPLEEAGLMLDLDLYRSSHDA